MESNDSPEIPDRGEASDIPGLPSGDGNTRNKLVLLWSIDEEDGKDGNIQKQVGPVVV